MKTTRTTPEYVNKLKDTEVFVFGSNESGIHGAGAAKLALEWGAKIGHGVGLHGKTYAIPTKDITVWNTLSLDKIGLYVDGFIAFAIKHPTLTFLVTEIGCGLAGLSPEQVAPLFKKAKDIPNIHLPKRFWEIINN